MNKILYILRALPGAGKTTLAKELVRCGGTMVAADDFMGKDFDPARLSECHLRCRTYAEEAMLLGTTPIVIHNTNTQTWEFAPYEALAKDYGYTVFHLIVENRHGNVSTHNVPVSHVRKMKERFEIQLVPEDHLKKDSMDKLYDDSLLDKDLSLKEVLFDMAYVPQQPEWHPEGSVYNHTALVVGDLLYHHDYAYGHADALLFAGLFHDLGKRETTARRYDKSEEGRLVSYGHEKVSVEYVKKYSYMIPDKVYDEVEWLVANHMRVKFINNMGKEKREALENHEWYDDLCEFSIYDDMKQLFASTDETGRKYRIGIFEQWVNELRFINVKPSEVI